MYCILIHIPFRRPEQHLGLCEGAGGAEREAEAEPGDPDAGRDRSQEGGGELQGHRADADAGGECGQGSPRNGLNYRPAGNSNAHPQGLALSMSGNRTTTHPRYTIRLCPLTLIHTTTTAHIWLTSIYVR